METNLQEAFKFLSQKYAPETIAIRRYIHSHPELSGRELKTADFIYKTLEDWGVKSEKWLDGTAVIALIAGKNPNVNFVAIRADMDALPIQEENNVEYKSKVKGVMHACGHDVHTAILLTVAKILNETKNIWKGSVLCVFEPSEEEFPGGAISLINSGLLKKNNIDAMLACHVSPEIPCGEIGYKSGPYMASTDELYVKIKGKGGHAALPSTFVNPLDIASDAIVLLKREFENQKPRNTPSVCTFGRMEVLGQTNVVADEAVLRGTLRTFDEKWRSEARNIIKNGFEKISEKYGGSAEVEIRCGYPVLRNDEVFTEKCVIKASEFLGEKNVKILDYRMTADDFAYFTQKIPCFFYRLGVGIPNCPLNLHSSTFDINEKVLEFAPALMSVLSTNESLI